MDNNKINIQSGTVSFWAEHSILINGDKVLLSLSPEGGSIMISIQEKYLKIAFIILGEGRTDISYPVNSFSDQSQHMIALSWDLPSRVLELFIDGVKVVSEPISKSKKHSS